MQPCCRELLRIDVSHDTNPQDSAITRVILAHPAHDVPQRSRLEGGRSTRMSDPVFVIVGAVFALLGLLSALNVGGAADRLARYNAKQRDSAARRRDAVVNPGGTYPETRRGMRLWGVVALLAGLLCIWAGFA